jgi:hypothetical protein
MRWFNCGLLLLLLRDARRRKPAADYDNKLHDDYGCFLSGRQGQDQNPETSGKVWEVGQWGHRKEERRKRREATVCIGDGEWKWAGFALTPHDSSAKGKKKHPNQSYRSRFDSNACLGPGLTPRRSRGVGGFTGSLGPHFSNGKTPILSAALLPCSTLYPSRLGL